MRDASAYLDGGMDGLVVENFGDVPYFADTVPPETIAALTAVAREIRTLGRFPLGINVLRSDTAAALAIAVAAEADFIRANVLAGAMLTDQGIIQGRAAELMRMRGALGARVAVWADVLVKHAVPLGSRDPGEVARDLKERALADALIVTGSRTGSPIDAKLLGSLRRQVGRVHWIAGSGIAPDNLEQYWSLADGFLVATALEKGRQPGAAVDPERVRKLVRAKRRLSGSGT